MEPAVKRQEHPVNPALGMIFALAQRSSPSDGSSMQFAFEGLVDDEEPQWSPPLKGGSIRAEVRRGGCCTACRNGARRLNGGSTNWHGRG
jgi:hypothetical protein